MFLVAVTFLFGYFGFHLCFCLAKSALAILVALNGFLQVVFAEIGPVGIAEVQVCLGNLP